MYFKMFKIYRKKYSENETHKHKEDFLEFIPTHKKCVLQFNSRFPV